jgi:hypothetical protein
MDPNMNYRHSQVHAEDLHRRAELHRLAAEARTARRDEKAARPSLLAPAGLLETIQATMGRVGTRLRHPSAATRAARN